MKEFWPEIVTQASWEELQRISKEMDFVLIGGWALFLWTGKHKSKDIDIIIDLKTLSTLKEKFVLRKNDRLKKYEIKKDAFDIDVYVPFFSKLSVPPEDLLNEKHFTRIQGIKTAKAESLLILKQAALADRKNSIKGMKDEIDIITLLISVDINWKKYKELLRNYHKEYFEKELVKTIKGFNNKNTDYLGISFQEFTNWKKKILEIICA